MPVTGWSERFFASKIAMSRAPIGTVSVDLHGLELPGHAALTIGVEADRDRAAGPAAGASLSVARWVVPPKPVTWQNRR